MSYAMNANFDPTLANRYLTDKLSEQERHDYEELMISSPAVVSELEATARLKVGLQKLQETGELDRLLQQRGPSLPTFLLPLAAALAAVVIGATLWWPTFQRPVGSVDHQPSAQSIANPVDSPATAATATLLFASHTSLLQNLGHPLLKTITLAFYRKRGEVPIERLEKPVSPTEVVLRARPTPLIRSHLYRLTLSRLRGTAFERVAQIDSLTPVADDGFVECHADAARLTPGSYQVILTDQTAPSDTEGEVFMFDLR